MREQNSEQDPPSEESQFLHMEQIEKRYALENAVLEAVTAGNEAAALDYVSQIVHEPIFWRLPDRQRDMRDYLISANTLMRKAVERAGIHPILIDRLSGSMIPLIEKASLNRQGLPLMQQMIHSYCRMVQEHHYKIHSPLIARIVTYIDMDLRADLSLKTLSGYLQVNASYLSALFSREMGISLTDYVNERRIEQAKTLLVSTNLPIKSIAQQCGFTDIHYFSRLFRRIADSTPRAYREAHGYGKQDP